ncbi:MAG TPA: hypothetical protein VEZ90_09815 [Blastocatellia bacterium]|nr:hypothetical protein [Blastocatellia bacterium]
MKEWAMLLGDVMTVFLGVAAFVILIPALWRLCQALWPDRAAQAAARCSRNIYKPLLVGVPVTFIALILAGTFKRLPAGGALISGALLCSYLVFASIGISGLAHMIGQRLAGHSTVRPMQSTVRGSAVLVLTYLIPVLGWFLILPASLIIGAGAAALSFFNAGQKTIGASLAPSLPHTATRDLTSEYRGFAAGR